MEGLPSSRACTHRHMDTHAHKHTNPSRACTPLFDTHRPHYVNCLNSFTRVNILYIQLTAWTVYISHSVEHIDRGGVQQADWAQRNLPTCTEMQWLSLKALSEFTHSNINSCRHSEEEATDVFLIFESHTGSCPLLSWEVFTQTPHELTSCFIMSPWSVFWFEQKALAGFSMMRLFLMSWLFLWLRWWWWRWSRWEVRLPFETSQRHRGSLWWPAITGSCSTHPGLTEQGGRRAVVWTTPCYYAAFTVRCSSIEARQRLRLCSSFLMLRFYVSYASVQRS